MATLEVNDGQGRVRFVELERDHPVLFGTSASCDLKLTGEGVLPVHGRIRFKADRFRIEASPDAEFVVVNGHKMSTSSLLEGDVVTVGPCRLVVARLAEDEGKVVAPGAHAAAQRKAGGRARGDEDGGGLFEGEDAAAALRSAAAPVHGRQESYDVDRKRRRGQAASAPAQAPQPEPPRQPSPAVAALRKIQARLTSWLGEGRPGNQNLLTSPLVIGLVASLVLLVGLGFWLRGVIASNAATALYNRGVQSYEDGDFRTAMRDLAAFAQGNPKDERASRARVLNAFGNVRQYVSPDGATWSTALEAAHEMVDRTSGEEAYRDSKTDLADVILRIGEGLADRARRTADRKSLELAEDAVRLHAETAGEPAPELLIRSGLPSKIEQARAAVVKSETRLKLLAVMNDSIKAGSAAKAYEARDSLLEQYADLAKDAELVRAMTAANELIQKAVKIDRKTKRGQTGPRPEPLGPPLTLISREQTPRASQGTAATAGQGERVYALADGIAFGLSATTGAPVWQRPVGLASPYPPFEVPGDGTVLFVDSRSNELVRAAADTGQPRWRIELPERVDDPPLVLGNQLIQVLPRGDVLFIGLDSGTIQVTLKLGRPLARTPVHDESGRHIYVLGRQDTLFIIGRDPIACTAVEYLGHAEASIPCAPGRFGRYLVIPENDQFTDSIWHVWVLDQEGAHARPVQDVKVQGWTWDTPRSAGSVVWAAADRGAYEAFSVGDYNSKTPFQSVARLTPDARPTGPTFALARSERELWVASAHPGLYVLDMERGTIRPKAPMPLPGPACAPLQLAGGIVAAVFTDKESGGRVVWGIDSESGEIVWKTLLGMPWPTPLIVEKDGASLIGRDGKRLTIAPDQAARGGFLEAVTPRAGSFVLPAGARLRVQAEGKALDMIVPKALGKTLWLEAPGERNGWKTVVLPVDLAATPILWSGGLLAPGSDQRVYLVDPITAKPLSEPFVPRFDRDRQGQLLEPVPLEGDSVAIADTVGRVRRLMRKSTPSERLSLEAEATLDKGIIARPAATGSAVVVVTADGQVHSLVARDLSPTGAWPLDAPLAQPPVSHADGALVVDQAGGIMAFDRDGRRAWYSKLNKPVVGPPTQHDGVVYAATADGVFHALASDDGRALSSEKIGEIPSGGLFFLGGKPVLATGASSLRPITLPKAPEAQK